AHSPIMRDVVAKARGGVPVLGICNGFQVLIKAGLLPGPGEAPGAVWSERPPATLTHNASGRFECRWVTLRPQPSNCLWTEGIEDTIDCPIAHGEGRYVHPDVDALTAAGQVTLTYVGANPNGSIASIAGVCNPAGNVLGLMPHPENHLLPRQHPTAGLDPARDPERHLGLRIFRNGVAAAAQM
ncbi:MAG: phosphoribosylformylglycinamidine synthase subunit PurQ, partial [Solirubrobacterales bacterium]|nr:phosphoribosylformylglycinamidine synthase subunit PurQ [Solirubrobacterales bacterium]